MAYVARVVVAVVGLGLGADGVRFDPEPGTELVRTFEFESEFEFEDWTVVWNGQEAPAEFLPELWIEGREEARAVVRDRVLAAADGRVTALERSFEGLEARDVMEATLSEVVVEEWDAEGVCALDGCAVRFEGGEVLLERGDAPDEVVEGLELDLDFTALLAGAADGEDAWEAPAAALVPGGLPGGLAFEFDDVPEEERTDAEAWLENLEGEWRVQRLESREDGALEVFALEGELSTVTERETDLEQVPIVDGDATESTSMQWTATGELVWDVERRALRTLAVEVATRSTVVTERVLEGVEGEPTYLQTMHMAGRAALKVSVETP